jgi:hypothetical protein
MELSVLCTSHARHGAASSVISSPTTCRECAQRDLLRRASEDRIAGKTLRLDHSKPIMTETEAQFTFSVTIFPNPEKGFCRKIRGIRRNLLTKEG